MDPNGDITDTFDDDEFANTVESGTKGPWNDDSAVFEDPTVKGLKDELAGTKTSNYQQRRMRELQERSAKAAAQAGPTPRQQAQQETWGDAPSAWGDEAADQQDPAGAWGNEAQTDDLQRGLDWSNHEATADQQPGPAAAPAPQPPANRQAGGASTRVGINPASKAAAQQKSKNVTIAIAVVVLLAAAGAAYALLV